METTNIASTSANIITDLSIENAVFLADKQRRKMINRTSPYNMMCAMDRYAQLVYRLNITDLGDKREVTVGSKLKGTFTVNTSLKAYLKAHMPGDENTKKIEAAAYRYEKQNAFYGQHFNVVASGLGIGNSMNLAGFSAVSGSMPLAEAAFALYYQIVTGGLALANMIGFRYRFSNKMNPETVHKDPTKIAIGQLLSARSIEDWKGVRYTLSGGVANIGGALNAGAFFGMSLSMLNYSITKGDQTKIAYYACQSVIALSSIASNSLKAAALYGRVDKPLVGNFEPMKAGALSVAGSSFSVFQSLAATASLSAYLASPNLSPSQKAAIGGEMAQQVGGGIMLLVVDEYLAKLTLGLVSNTVRLALGGFGTMAAALMVCLSPIQIQSLIDQSSYADNGASDYVNAGGGNDIIVGAGAGFDTLIGGEGFDVLDYSSAEGYNVVSGVNTTRFGAGNQGVGVSVDLSKTVKATVNGVSGDYAVVNAGGKVAGVYQSSDLVSGIEALRGTRYADNLVGDTNDNYLDGYDGNDTIAGGGGNDTLVGGLGRGGAGSDIYRFDRQSGADRIEEDGSVENITKTGVDTLFIDARSDELWFRRSSNDLVIDIMGSQDPTGSNPANYALIKNYFASSRCVERIVANDGKKIDWGSAVTLADSLMPRYAEKSGATCLAETSMSAADQATAKSYWKSDATVSNLITAMAQMAPPAAGTTLTTADYQNRVSAIYAANVI